MTDIITAMENRHAVRAYDPEKKIPKEITDMLREKIDLLNAESKLHIRHSTALWHITASSRALPITLLL